MAYRELHGEIGDPADALIRVGLVAKGETLDDFYRHMVDEDMVRRMCSGPKW